MNDLQKELQDLKAKVAELEARIVAETVEKWQPKGGGFMIWGSGDIEEVDSINSSRCFGTERQTKEQAERTAVEMRRFNRLLALRDELCGDEVVDWNDGRWKHYVYFSHSDKEWRSEFNDDYESLMPYFTTEESAQRACDMLNSGEVEL